MKTTPQRPAPADLPRTPEGLAERPDPLGVCRTIRRLREEQGMTQADLARRLRIPQSYIHRWEQNRVPRLDDLYSIEVDGFGLRPGSILTELGFCLTSVGAPDAIAADTRLKAPERRMLLAAYWSAVDA